MVRRAIGPALLLVLLPALPARAEDPPAAPPAPQALAEDEVTLDNGSVFRGTLIEEDDEKVVLQRVSEQGGVSKITFPRKRISTLRRAGPRGQDGPTVVVVRDAWFLLRSGGEIVGTRRLVLRSLRSGGEPGFRLEETIVQLPQGRRIPLTRIERSEDTDARFLPRRMSYREALEPAGDDAAPRFERSAVGTVRGSAWSASWRRGEAQGTAQLTLPPQTRGPLGLRELLLRDERVAGLHPVSVLDPAQDGLVDAEVGFASLGGGSDRPDELHWVERGVRRVLRVRGSEILEESLGEALLAVPTTEARARAVEAAGQGPASARELTFAEQGLTLTLPGPEWTVTRPVPSVLDTGWRLLARLASAPLTADARLEWDPEGTPPGQSAEAAEAALLARLKAVCPDLAVVRRRAPVEGLPGAFSLLLLGTLRGTALYTLALSVPRGAGRVVLLAACPETAWEVGRPVLERLLASVRGL